MMDVKLIGTAPVTISRPNRLSQMYVLSAFVWREADAFRVAVRAVPRRDDKPELKISEIWFGASDDGRRFEMDKFPSIFPDRGTDLDGCEDPTVVAAGGGLLIAYTGYNAAEETGRLLGAASTHDGVSKRGVLIDSAAPFFDPKEAAFAPTARGWRMLFEYADRGTGLSAIGAAVADGIEGPWRTVPDRVLERREGRWDHGHMSPGVVLRAGTDAPILFYNGGGETDGWRVGWAVMDRDLTQVIHRCDEPLIVPTDLPGKDARDMAFVSSALEHNGRIRLYYTVADQDVRVADIKVVDDSLP